MKAKLIYRHKVQNAEEDILEIVIWALPEKTPDRPHGIKYRCYYGDSSGKCYIRYDNELDKGDHRHIGEDREEPYQFVSVEKLMQDFLNDIQHFPKMRR